MKKLIVLSFLLMTTIFVNAQRRGGGPPSPEMRAEKMVTELTSELNLSTAQQAQLKGIFMEQHQSRKAGGKNMRDLSQEEKEAFRADRKAGKAEMDNKIAAILTPAQLETFQNSAAERQANRGQRGGAKGKKGQGKAKGKAKNKEKATPEIRAQKRADKLTETLGLDANQQDAVYRLFLQQTPKQRVDRGNLSKEEKELLKAERQQEKAAFDTKLAQILTPTQLEQFRNLPKKEKKKGKKKGKKNRK